jgi:hypothetical protein
MFSSVILFLSHNFSFCNDSKRSPEQRLLLPLHLLALAPHCATESSPVSVPERSLPNVNKSMKNSGFLYVDAKEETHSNLKSILFRDSYPHHRQKWMDPPQNQTVHEPS